MARANPSGKPATTEVLLNADGASGCCESRRLGVTSCRQLSAISLPRPFWTTGSVPLGGAGRADRRRHATPATSVSHPRSKSMRTSNDSSDVMLRDWEKGDSDRERSPCAGRPGLGLGATKPSDSTNSMRYRSGRHGFDNRFASLGAGRFPIGNRTDPGC